MTIVGIRIVVLGRVKWIVRDSSNGGFVDFLAISRCSARRALHELDECIIFSSYFLSPVYYILCVSLFFSNFHFCTYLILIYCLSYISTGIFSEQWGFEKCVSRQDLRGIHPMVVGIEHTKRAVGARICQMKGDDIHTECRVQITKHERRCWSHTSERGCWQDEEIAYHLSWKIERTWMLSNFSCLTFYLLFFFFSFHFRHRHFLGDWFGSASHCIALQNGPQQLLPVFAEILK